MPLYMDRHDLHGATSADLAAAHLRDLEVQDMFGVRFITYWFEEEAGSGFCLIEGPDKESVVAAHRASHGMLPANVVEIDQANVRAFFGRLEYPSSRRAIRGKRLSGYLLHRHRRLHPYHSATG